MFEDHALWLAVAFSLASIVILVAGFLISWIREDKRHDWHIEQMKEARDHLDRQDTSIQNGTDKAGKAYTEANAINRKIVELQKELAALLEKEQKK